MPRHYLRLKHFENVHMMKHSFATQFYVDLYVDREIYLQPRERKSSIESLDAIYRSSETKQNFLSRQHFSESCKTLMFFFYQIHRDV